MQAAPDTDRATNQHREYECKDVDNERPSQGLIDFRPRIPPVYKGYHGTLREQACDPMMVLILKTIPMEGGEKKVAM